MAVESQSRYEAKTQACLNYPEVGSPNRGRQYGSVELTGEARAHLGDIVQNGAITVHQLNMMVGSSRTEEILTVAQDKNNSIIDTPQVMQSLLSAPRPLEHNEYSPAAVYRKLARALFFREEGFRRYDVKDAHEKTFQWIFQTPRDALWSDFPHWLRAGKGCYWINGKPGSGKSTLMKYIMGHDMTAKLWEEWAGENKCVVSSFFFWHLGTELQKSYEGIMRSLLYQILKVRPELTPTIFPDLTLYLLTGGVDNNLNFHASELQAGLKLLLANMPNDMRLFLVIDGIDEYNGDHFDFCRLIATIAEHPSVKVLVSSRPIPACCQLFSRYSSLKLHDLTFKDIKDYVEVELLQNPLLVDLEELQPGFSKFVGRTLIEKASGVFLWVVLVVKNLLVGLGNYDDSNTLISTIDQLPSDLGNLYNHLFASMSPEHQKQGSFLLDVLARSLRLQQGQGVTAIQASFFSMPTDGRTIGNLPVKPTEAAKSLRVKMLEGQLRSRCRGLMEVQHRWLGAGLSEPRVNYLHRTVVEYLNEYSIWDQLRLMHKMTDLQMDKVIVDSCAEALEYVETLSGRLRSGQDIERELLGTCYACSLSLQRAGYGSWLKALVETDTAFMNHCLDNISAFTLADYNRFYTKPTAIHYSITSFDGSEEDDGFWREYTSLPITRDQDRSSYFEEVRTLFGHGPTMDFDNMSIETLGQDDFLGPASIHSVDEAMYRIASSDLLPFWQQKLESCPEHLYSKAGVLLKLIQDFEAKQGENTGNLSQSIICLIKKLDPNAFLRKRDDVWGVWEDVNDSEENLSGLTPWDYWLVTSKKPSSCRLQITLAFMEAGADLSSTRERNAKAQDMISDVDFPTMSEAYSTLQSELVDKFLQKCRQKGGQHRKLERTK